MADIVIYLLINSLWIWGFRCLFSEGMIMNYLGNLFENHFPEWVTKPLFGCPPCMSSYHGTVFYFFVVNQGFATWPIYCVCLCGLNFIIAKLTSKERVIIDE